MTFDELIAKAKDLGYQRVLVSGKMKTLDEYIDLNKDNIKTYTLRDNGTVTTFADDMEWFDGTRFIRFSLVE